jgi:hypothetical protein
VDCKVMHANCITFDPFILSVLLKMTLNVKKKIETYYIFMYM